jgi:hypothetical protein
MKSSFLRWGSALLCAVILSACGGNNGSLALQGTISGLSKSGLVLVNKNTGEKLTIAAYQTSFVFTKLMAQDEAFDIEIDTAPAGATCTLTNNKAVATVYTSYTTAVTCKNNPHVLGGTVKGLSGTGLVLANGADSVPVLPPATAGADVTFVFPTNVGDGDQYGVTVLTQPAGQSCTVNAANNPGTMPSADQLGLLVNCVSK